MFSTLKEENVAGRKFHENNVTFQEKVMGSDRRVNMKIKYHRSLKSLTAGSKENLIEIFLVLFHIKQFLYHSPRKYSL